MLTAQDKKIDLLLDALKFYTASNDGGDRAKQTLYLIEDMDRRCCVVRKKYRITFEDKWGGKYFSDLEGYHLNFDNVRNLAQGAMRASLNLTKFTITETILKEESDEGAVLNGDRTNVH